MAIRDAYGCTLHTLCDGWDSKQCYVSSAEAPTGSSHMRVPAMADEAALDISYQQVRLKGVRVSVLTTAPSPRMSNVQSSSLLIYSGTGPHCCVHHHCSKLKLRNGCWRGPPLLGQAQAHCIQQQ